MLLSDLIRALPYLGGIGTFLIAIFNWIFSALKEERNHYENLYQEKQKEVGLLKDEINKKNIEIVKLKASLKLERDASFSRKEENEIE